MGLIVELHDCFYSEMGTRVDYIWEQCHVVLCTLRVIFYSTGRGQLLLKRNFEELENLQSLRIVDNVVVHAMLFLSATGVRPACMLTVRVSAFHVSTFEFVLQRTQFARAL